MKHIKHALSKWTIRYSPVICHGGLVVKFTVLLKLENYVKM